MSMSVDGSSQDVDTARGSRHALYQFELSDPSEREKINFEMKFSLMDVARDAEPQPPWAPLDTLCH